MANLKRNYIELVKEVKEGEVITETYFTPVFIPFNVIYEATDIMEAAQEKTKKEREIIQDMGVFIAESVYKNQFTVKELYEGLHAPNALETLRSQLAFIIEGQQDDATKKFLAEKKR